MLVLSIESVEQIAHSPKQWYFIISVKHLRSGLHFRLGDFYVLYRMSWCDIHAMLGDVAIECSLIKMCVIKCNCLNDSNAYRWLVLSHIHIIVKVLYNYIYIICLAIVILTLCMG